MDHTCQEEISLLIHHLRYLISLPLLPLLQFSVSFHGIQKSCILGIRIVFRISLREQKMVSLLIDKIVVYEMLFHVLLFLVAIDQFRL